MILECLVGFACDRTCHDTKRYANAEENLGNGDTPDFSLGLQDINIPFTNVGLHSFLCAIEAKSFSKEDEHEEDW